GGRGEGEVQRADERRRADGRPLSFITSRPAADVSFFAAGREKGFALMRRFLKAVAAVALLLAFSLESGVPARGQLIGVGRGRGRRVGRGGLPPPPFNPDAGILDRPKGR